MSKKTDELMKNSLRSRRLKISPSEKIRHGRLFGGKKQMVEFKSFLPIVHYPEDKKMMSDWNTRLMILTDVQRKAMINSMGQILSDKAKSGEYKKYGVYCRVCGDLQGYLWSKDKNGEDWSDFHYVNYHEGDEWHGCLTPQLSPVDNRLGFECCCGNDSRDFRKNFEIKKELKDENIFSRQFNKGYSKFQLKVIK